MFQAHAELLHWFLVRRDEIVERIQGLLNAQRRPAQFLQGGPALSREFQDCFFKLSALTQDQARLRGQLEEARAASDFRPRLMPGLHNDLVDPAQMMIRGFHLWQRTRWPGRNGRVRFAQTLFDLYVLRCLELLVLRLWDTGPDGAGDRLAQLQGVLDLLNRTTPADQPVLVRDARWLIPVAQSPTTDELAPYFVVLEQIATSLAESDRTEIHKASVQMAGGHLRSQLRHYCTKSNVSLNEKSLILSSRNSNALDFAVLVQGLVPLLETYERACQSDDLRHRLELAQVICQGISADPELFVNRVELLGAYTMIEHLFATTHADGRVAYTPMGRRHLKLLQEYAQLIGRLSKPLLEDCPRFKPVDGAYSPYGLIYGFSSNLTEHMALKTLQPDAATRFSLEDVFTDEKPGTGKLAWVSGWRKLPHIDPEVLRLFDYPQQFAEEIFARIEHALQSRAGDGEAHAVVGTGRLFIVPENDPEAARETSGVPDLPVRYIASSDPQRVAADEAHSYDQARLLYERQEGMFAVSYPTSHGWVAITKDLLTEELGAGRDTKIEGLPTAAADMLRLMCPNLVAEALR